MFRRCSRRSSISVPRVVKLAGVKPQIAEAKLGLKQHKQVQIMMKRVKKMGGTKQFLARGLPPGLPPGFLPR
jgi:hypothetical protein